MQREYLAVIITKDQIQTTEIQNFFILIVWFAYGWLSEIPLDAHDRLHGYCRSSGMPSQFKWNFCANFGTPDPELGVTESNREEKLQYTNPFVKWFVFTTLQSSTADGANFRGSTEKNHKDHFHKKI